LKCEEPVTWDSGQGIGGLQTGWAGGGRGCRRLGGKREALYRKGKKNHQSGARCFVHQRTLSSVKRVQCINDKMSCAVLRGRWCNITVLNPHALSEDKSDGSKGSLYEQ